MASQLKENKCGEKDSISLVENFVEALTNIPLTTNDIVLVNGYALALLEKWKALDFEDYDDNLATFYSIGQLEKRLNDYVSLCVYFFDNFEFSFYFTAYSQISCCSMKMHSKL